MVSSWVRASVVCSVLFGNLLFGNPAAAASPSNPDGELTLTRAIDAALGTNPELRASSYELSAAQARQLQAGLRPNPELGVTLENFAGSGAVRGTDGLETTLSLSQVVELGGKRQWRESAANAAIEVVTLEQRARELDLLAEVTRKFIDGVAAQERARFASEATSLAQQTLNAIDARVTAGRSPEAERSRARIAVTRAQIEQRQASSQLRSARYALATTWGSAEPAFSGLRADLFELRTLPSFSALLARWEQSPDTLKLASARRLQEAQLRLAQAQARPNLSFDVGVRRLEESGDTALVAGFSMPLPFSDRNQGAIREAQVRALHADAQLEAQQTRTRASLFALYQEIEAARERVGTLRGEAVPQAQLALDQTRNGYERGRFSFLELASSQEELLALRAAAIDAAADYHRLCAELERLTGAALTVERSAR